MLKNMDLAKAQELAALTVKDVTKVYKHRANAKGTCRCGCGGYYWRSSYNANPDEQWHTVNNKRVAQVLALVQAHPELVTAYGGWFDLKHPTDGCEYTVYTD